MSNEEEALATKAYMYWVGRAENDAAHLNPHLTTSEKETEMLGDRIDELVRREDVEALFKPQQHSRTLENLSRRLQAAAANPLDKEEVLTVAKKISNLADERNKLLNEVQNSE